MPRSDKHHLTIWPVKERWPYCLLEAYGRAFTVTGALSGIDWLLSIGVILLPIGAYIYDRGWLAACKRADIDEKESEGL